MRSLHRVRLRYVPALKFTKNIAHNAMRGGVAGAPHSVMFQLMSSSVILAALESGAMQGVAAQLAPIERRRVAEYLAGLSATDKEPADVFACEKRLNSTDVKFRHTAIDWGMNSSNTRYVDKQTAGLSAVDVPDLILQWAFAFPRATRARSQPAVANGVVYVGSQDGTVYALDLKHGCTYWTFQVEGEVRTGITLKSTDINGGMQPSRVYFGDFNGHVYALDAITGELNWKVLADPHPDATITGSPMLHNNRLYVPISSREWGRGADPNYSCCTFRGGVTVLDSESGQLVSCIKLTVDMRAFDAHAPLLSKSPQHFLSIRTVFYLRYVFR